MELSQITPSRQYSWVYEAEAKLNKGRDTIPLNVALNNLLSNGTPVPYGPQMLNPLYGRVTCRKVYAGMAASAEMYVNQARKLNPTWQASDRTPTFEETSNPCVVRSLASGQLQVRILKPRTVKREYFVDGRLATSEEMAIIQAYLPSRKANPLAVKIMFPYVDNLANVEGELTGEESED